MLRKDRSVAAVLMVASLLLTGVGGPSAAASEVMTVSVPLHIDHYDVAVAEANGYRIITHEDGTQESVPVTAAAMAESAAHEDATDGDFSINGSQTVPGDCGWSEIEVRRNGLNFVNVGTGFDVEAPVIARYWWVQLYGGAGLLAIDFSGGESASTWSGAQIAGYSSGGTAYVTGTSFVILKNGGVCWSASPTTTF